MVFWGGWIASFIGSQSEGCIDAPQTIELPSIPELGYLSFDDCGSKQPAQQRSWGGGQIAESTQGYDRAGTKPYSRDPGILRTRSLRLTSTTLIH